MRLLKFDDHGELCLTRDLHVNIPRYAILSHTWGPDEDEVSFDDFMSENGKSLPGYAKIRSCGEQAKKDGLDYFWVDTCCIDKRSSSELSEAINSMYRWYAEAVVCYALLSDIDASSLSEPYALLSDIDASSLSEPDATIEGLALTNSVWFTRGWTLQELLAPKVLMFFDRNWTLVGSKAWFSSDIERHTGIPGKALKKFKPSEYCIGQRMAWAAHRKTTRLEDRAYSLFGLFNISMPLLYGEREKAFRRLQEELIRNYDDASIFAWSGVGDPDFGMLASSPECFSATPYPSTPSYALGIYTDGQVFSLSKSGIQGDFYLYAYALDIYILALGHDVSRPGIPVYSGIFVLPVENSTDRYRRVIVDGKDLVRKEPRRWYREEQKTRSVLFVRDAPMEVNSTHAGIDRDFKWFDIMWANQGRIFLPGQARPQALRNQADIQNWCAWDLEERLFLRKLSDEYSIRPPPSKCLCISRITDGLGSEFPALILRLNLDVQDEPVVLMSRVLCKSGRKRWDSLKVGTWENEEFIEGIYANAKSVLSLEKSRSSLPSILKALTKRSTSVTTTHDHGDFVVERTDKFPTPSRIIDIPGVIRVYFFEENDGWEVRFKIIDDRFGFAADDVSHTPKSWLISEAHYIFLQRAGRI